jgi:hypothetical protein
MIIPDSENPLDGDRYVWPLPGVEGLVSGQAAKKEEDVVLAWDVTFWERVSQRSASFGVSDEVLLVAVQGVVMMELVDAWVAWQAWKKEGE